MSVGHKNSVVKEGSKILYVIGAEDRAKKVGITNDLDSRIRTLQCATPFVLRVLESFEIDESTAFSVEKDAHCQLKSRHIVNEWFDVELNEALLACEVAIICSGQQVKHFHYREACHWKKISKEIKTRESLKMSPLWLRVCGSNLRQAIDILGFSEHDFIFSGALKNPKNVKEILGGRRPLGGAVFSLTNFFYDQGLSFENEEWVKIQREI